MDRALSPGKDSARVGIACGRVGSAQVIRVYDRTDQEPLRLEGRLEAEVGRMRRDSGGKRVVGIPSVPIYAPATLVEQYAKHLDEESFFELR